jgi:large subunit ribosomal protein L21
MSDERRAPSARHCGKHLSPATAGAFTPAAANRRAGAKPTTAGPGSGAGPLTSTISSFGVLTTTTPSTTAARDRDGRTALRYTGGLMYAVIETGGKQYKVAEGDRLDVERLAGAEVTLRPVLVVDGEEVLATSGQLGSASVTARVVGEAKGPKIKGFTYKNKSNQRKRWGHRQHYSTIEITAITKG